MLLQLPSGLLLDRFGVRRVGIVSTIIWSVASFCREPLRPALADCSVRAFCWALAKRRHFLAIPRQLAIGFRKASAVWRRQRFDSMAKFSSAIGVPLLGLVLLHFGWRWNFAATGIISLVFFALFYAFYKNPSQDAKLSAIEREHIRAGGAQPEDAVRAAAGAPLGYLITQPKVIGLALGYGSYNYVFYLSAHLAADFLARCASSRSNAFRVLHQRAVAVRHRRRIDCRRLAGRFTHSARLECRCVCGKRFWFRAWRWASEFSALPTPLPRGRRCSGSPSPSPGFRLQRR